MSVNEKRIMRRHILKKTKGAIGFFVLVLVSIMSLVSFIPPSFCSESDEELSEDRIITPAQRRIVIPEKFDFTGAINAHYPSEEEYLKFVTFGGEDDVNAYGLALANLTVGLITRDPLFILDAKSLFRISENTSRNSREKEFSAHGIRYADTLLSGEFANIPGEKVVFEPVTIKRHPPEVRQFQKMVIGKSSITIRKGARIKTQVDRVTRDWLSAYRISNPPWKFSQEKYVPWHEGKKIKEILDAVDADVSVVWGTKAKKIENKWYAPDAEGIYRFRISEDKVYNYPTNILLDAQTLLINDTHGINTIAWDALDADLAVGCGDLDGKMEAAYYLADKGVDVYMPTDRFIAMLIGVKTKGTIIGSAPVRKTADGAVIGDQPVSVDTDEPIMVSNAKGGYPMQYYDAPYRYFSELARYTGRPLKIVPVEIDEYGRADKLVERAQREKVKIIGTRIVSKEEYEAVSRWLKADSTHRAILFHTAAYPEGYRLFFEFPAQTTFGDINISFE